MSTPDIASQSATAVYQIYAAVAELELEQRRRYRLWTGVGHVAGGILLILANRKRKSIRVEMRRNQER